MGRNVLSGTVARSERAESLGAPRSRHRRGRSGYGHAADIPTTTVYETVVLVPARNEEVGVFTTLESLAGQTRRPDHIVVVVKH